MYSPSLASSSSQFSPQPSLSSQHTFRRNNMGRAVAPLDRQAPTDRKRAMAGETSSSTSSTGSNSSSPPAHYEDAQQSSDTLSTPTTSLSLPTSLAVTEEGSAGRLSPGALSHENHSTTSSTTSRYTDARDEEEAEDSSLGYSDDSASLSDVYFLPGDDLARPGTYREQDSLLYSPSSSLGVASPLFAATYGSLTSSSDSAKHILAGGDGGGKHNSPFWMGGPIQEDTEAMMPEDENDLLFRSTGSDERLLVTNSTGTAHGSLPLTAKDRVRRQRKQKRYVQKMQKRLKEQAARERAVAKVRGQPQRVTLWRDWVWALVFVLQFVAVLLCAMRFGFGVLVFHDTGGGWGVAAPNQGAFWWNEEDAHQRFLLEQSSSGGGSGGGHGSVGGDKPVSSTGNTTLSDILFNIPDSSLKSDDSLGDDDAAPTADSSSFTIDYKNVLALTFFTGLYACVLAYLSFGFMLIIARSLIQIMLIFSIVVALGWGLIGLTLDPYGLIADMGFAAFLLTLGYTMFSWNRIPFAATNLYTALCAMRCTADITILGLVSLVVAFAWCLVWCTAFVGIVNSYNNSDCNKKDDCGAHVSQVHFPLYLLFIFSFHWTTMVIKNVVRVTVASAIGTWWFRPTEVGPFCTAAVVRPLVRSLTKSFGSICLASLLVEPAQIVLNIGKGCCFVCCSTESQCLHPPPDDEEKQALMANQNNESSSHKAASEQAKESADEEALDSTMEWAGLGRRCCRCFGPLHRFLRASNRWSYTYIGMYGYSFPEAGARALELFQTRQWVEVVEDSLIQNVLLMASVVIGGSAGVFAVVVEETDGYDFTSFHQPIISAFVIGSVLGYVLSNILLVGVVGSAVNTILVCFAAGPFEFDKNHPRLSREMREVWSQQVWEPPL